jgi:hypothetical protein
LGSTVREAAAGGGLFEGGLGIRRRLCGGIADENLERADLRVQLEGIARAKAVHIEAESDLVVHPRVGELRLDQLAGLGVLEGDHAGGEVLGGYLEIVHAAILEQFLAPLLLAPLEERGLRGDRDGLEEIDRLAQRREDVPGDRDAVAAHVAEDAAALLGGIPEPALVRPGVLFGAAGEGERAHGALLRGELLHLRLDALHVDLVFEVAGLEAGLFRERDEFHRLGDGAAKGLLADEALQLGARPSLRRRSPSRSGCARSSAQGSRPHPRSRRAP